MGFCFDGDFLWCDFGDFASELLAVVFVFCGCKNTSELAGVELAEEKGFLVFSKVGVSEYFGFVSF